MPADDWLIFAYVMIFSSVVFCGILPMIFRLINDRKRQAIGYSYSSTFFPVESIYIDPMVVPSDNDFYEHIDEDTSNC